MRRTPSALDYMRCEQRRTLWQSEAAPKHPLRRGRLWTPTHQPTAVSTDLGAIFVSLEPGSSASGTAIKRSMSNLDLFGVDPDFNAAVDGFLSELLAQPV
ncbi:hypothetical protein NXC24_PB00035 (plasmid) [Rhizobium sp. NXC24]|nr:hypothetical protein NXC24_PB00035 [Rhizobium sp. NXC24]